MEIEAAKQGQKDAKDGKVMETKFSNPQDKEKYEAAYKQEKTHTAKK